MADTAPNPIDENKQGLIGKPVDRVDGPLKVTGKATYAYEYLSENSKTTYGFILGSAIAKGRIIRMDTKAAKAAPGVLLVMTHENSPKQENFGPAHSDSPLERPKPFLDKTEIRYYGEPVALVVAEHFEQARDAAALITVEYERAEPRTDLMKYQSEGYAPEGMNGGPPDSAVGDFDKGFAEAAVKIDATYTTPYQHQMPMEPHASLAVWEGDKLTLYCSHQMPVSAHKSVAKTLKVSPDKVRIVCRYIGGGFGSKLYTESDAILSALAAKELKRPVKLTLTRQQEFFNVTHRTESVQRVRLGASEDGTLSALAHECWLQVASFDEFTEPVAMATRALYAAPNRRTSHRIIKLDLPSSGSMRAPGEAIGLMALEQAMDELAVKLNIDPIELRIRNEPREHPEKHIPFATRALIPCLREGAKRFGWDKRPAKPGTLRVGRMLIGYGMAAAYRSNYLHPSEARVKLDGQGRLTAELAMTDVGTGSYTVLTQIAAEVMQLPMNAVTVLIGDSDFPPTPGSGGSFGANSSGSGLYDACMNLRKALAEAAIKDKVSPLYGLDADKAAFTKGTLVIGDKSEGYGAIAARTQDGNIKAEGKIKDLDSYKTHSQAAYGGYFSEVAVDADSGEIRLRRMLGVFAAGRILNEKTARSQAIGAMIWGLGSALHEGSFVDPRHGHFVNHDLAEYHVAAHADAVNVEAIFLPEVDDKAGPLKIKGVGELGICGAGAAIANAVYNACGVRVRNYPITLDKIITGLA